MKKYRVTVPLETHEIIVNAKNSREAKKIALEKLNKKEPSKYVDHQNTYVDEHFF